MWSPICRRPRMMMAGDLPTCCREEGRTMFHGISGVQPGTGPPSEDLRSGSPGWQALCGRTDR